MSKKIAIIGAGISGLSAAAYAAKHGNEVHVFEKHAQPGGRARQFTTENGYTFDMGPSWYWMPDIIENFFRDFNHKPEDFYKLISLNPQFQIVFSDSKLSVPENYQELKKLFEQMEKGSGEKLDAFMRSARYKYDVGMRDFVNKPCHNWSEFLSPKIAKSALKLDLLTNFRKYVGRYFKHPHLRALMEFPVIFLGASPKNIPALYSLMNYGGYALGTWYPVGGFYQLILAMEKIAVDNGVHFHFNHNIDEIISENDLATGIKTNGKEMSFDCIIASSDYHHTESLLNTNKKNYTEKYWESKTFAPSCLIYYLGFKERLPNLQHHTLFFENDMDAHIDSIYTDKKWPEKPLFYTCCPSRTDDGVAPEGHENVFLLMPLAIGIEDNEAIREQYFTQMITRLEHHTGTSNLVDKIDYKRSYCIKDFITDYNAYKGNAYGLANTLKQTAVLKPSIKNKQLQNLFYTGQLTVPGPGVPPSIISGRIVANEVNNLKKFQYEKAI
ncbi:phytoene desaturase family protein [Polluticaenibacter yanchengensis]|uniref:Oleate hydratase n=1 Tax=Polluticaenibacter yanchengensis TaxID=3014562 RepID=A0ABT4UHZ1_9BACT|nr:oleate hydratase [Chitinophagaceae bacterium LY-5]